MREVREILDTVFGRQLMRFYKAATLENLDLLEHYGFSHAWAGSVRRSVESILGAKAPSAEVSILPRLSTPNVCGFYEETIHHLPRRPADQIHVSWLHGDLNGANIILDSRSNVWLIDFARARRGHVLMDLVKLENDLLYIWTPVDTDDDVRHACALTHALLEVDDLAAPLPEAPAGLPPQFERAYEVIRHLRGFYPRLIESDRDPFQLQVAQLRYAVHNLSFEESTPRQLKWALYAAGQLSSRIAASLARSVRLRVDWLDERWTVPGRFGLTILPGRKDWGRDLTADVAALQAERVTRVLCLSPLDELQRYGVDDLMAAYAAAGIQARLLPVVDQQSGSQDEMRDAVRWIHEALMAGENVVAHCVGGIGRTGMAAASYLRARGADAEEAIEAVRKARSPRALETPTQEQFVRDFPRGLLSPS